MFFLCAGCQKGYIEGTYVDEKGEKIIDFRKKYCYSYDFFSTYPYELINNYIYVHMKDDVIIRMKIKDKDNISTEGLLFPDNLRRKSN
jgi:hypothetical protein